MPTGQKGYCQRIKRRLIAVALLRQPGQIRNRDYFNRALVLDRWNRESPELDRGGAWQGWRLPHFGSQVRQDRVAALDTSA
jgi:hypothetical protein